MADPLFPAPEPAHPDEQVAREEITRYYEDQIAEADEALTAAQDTYRRRLADQDAWRQRGEITADPVADTDMGPLAIVAAAQARYHAAAFKAIYEGGDKAEAERLGEREKALRRWLTANGHDLGPLAEPARQQRRKGGRR